MVRKIGPVRLESPAGARNKNKNISKNTRKPAPSNSSLDPKEIRGFFYKTKMFQLDISNTNNVIV